MNRVINGAAALLAVICVMASTGCTPGKEQARKGFSSSVFGDKSERSSGYDEEINFSDNDSRANDRNVMVRSGRPDNEKIRAENADIYKEPARIRASEVPDEKFFQKGYASWYGREFHGKVTASGEKFDMYQYTAAHKTLPFGTVVSVRNMSNGKTITARINDRGPYRGKRILDLSFASAKQLGMVEPGMALVGISIIRKGNTAASDRYNSRSGSPIEPVSGDINDNSGSRRASEGFYSIQTGAFYSSRNAQRLRQQISSLVNVPVVVVRDGDLYKVRIRGISNRREAATYKRLLADENIPSYLINAQE